MSDSQSLSLRPVRTFRILSVLVILGNPGRRFGVFMETRKAVRSEKQLSLKSRAQGMWRPPGGAVPEHSVEDDEQLAHAGHQRHLLGFTGAYQPLVERLYSRVAARGHQGTHVQRRPHPRPAAPDGALASKDARVTVQGSDAHESGQLLVLKRAKLRQLGQ